MRICRFINAIGCALSRLRCATSKRRGLFNMIRHPHMHENTHKSEFPELADENRRIWDTNARWWDDRIGDGNDFQMFLIEPATERLLEISRDDVILDIACGAGRFARRMAELGGQVVAIDWSAEFIARARSRTR